jgi:hypothetical protein
VTEHSLETSAAERLQSTSVADYIVQRIADEGIARIALESPGTTCSRCATRSSATQRPNGSVVRTN